MEHGTRNLVLIFVAVLLLGEGYAQSGHQNNNKRIVKITARMFEYSPSRIGLKKGESVILELTSLDRIHGFNVPDLGLRADVLPGQFARVELTPERAGRYTFLCDIFCGDGHGEMSGVIVVKD